MLGSSHPCLPSLFNFTTDRPTPLSLAFLPRSVHLSPFIFILTFPSIFSPQSRGSESGGRKCECGWTWASALDWRCDRCARPRPGAFSVWRHWPGCIVGLACRCDGRTQPRSGGLVGTRAASLGHIVVATCEEVMWDYVIVRRCYFQFWWDFDIFVVIVRLWDCVIVRWIHVIFLWLWGVFIWFLWDVLCEMHGLIEKTRQRKNKKEKKKIKIKRAW